MDIAQLSALLEKEGLTHVTDEEFDAAAQSVKSLQGLDTEQMGNLYGLYKQGHVGDINIPQPWSIQVQESMKW
jgi:acyl-CoA-binding protein